MRITWIRPKELLEHEFTQAEEEGRDVASLKQGWQKVKGQEHPTELDSLLAHYWARLEEIPPGPFDVHEPSNLSDIFANCSAPQTLLSVNLAEKHLQNKLKGGWLGRAAGCLLGKPVEGKPRHWIRELLLASNRWPLDHYFTAAGVPAEVFSEYTWHRSHLESLQENIICMPEDDDLNYTMLNLQIAEEFGLHFTSSDVLQTWLTTLPVLQVFTAERVAYVNALRLLTPPVTAQFRNPYREWIGAQIRADLWGWIAPGNPRLAVELAYRDAVVSHTKNGIYGELFFAALIAASFAVDDVREAILLALEYIPEKSRFNEAIRFVMDLTCEKYSFEGAMDRINEQFGHYHWVHTINNAALLIAALLYGGNDFEQTICYAVSGGWDTDCNGATAGSILGVLLGAEALPAKWIAPLNNRIRTSLYGFDNSSFDDLAQRTLKQVYRFQCLKEKSD